MGLVDEAIGAIVALFIIIVFFGFVFPELAKVTGINVVYTYLLGFLMVMVVLLYLVAAIMRR